MKVLFALLILIPSTVLAQPSIFSDEGDYPSTDLTQLQPALQGISALDGGSFGVMAVDLATGETVGVGTDREYDIGNPDMFAIPCALDRVAGGEQSLDYQVSPDRNFEDILIVAGTGNDEYTSKVFSVIGRDVISSWLSSEGLSDSEVNGVFLDWEGAPVPLPNTSTPADCAQIVLKMNEMLSSSVARRVLADPLDGAPVMEGYGDSFSAVYGVSSVDAAGSSRGLVLVYPDGRRVGLVLLADQLCCESRPDLALRMALDALAEL
jgi:hypothetical protein